MPKAFVILDRDGTIIDHVHYLTDPKFVRFKKDLIKSLIKLRNAGFSFGIISNQSVIGRGMATLEEVNNINNLIVRYLVKHGISFGFIYICPHISGDNCNCRKPNTLLGKLAIIEHGLLPSQSYVIGDQENDLAFAKNLGSTAVQVAGNARESALADYYSETLNGATDWILANNKSKGRKWEP